MLEVTKVAPQQAIKNAGEAYNRFFKKRGSFQIQEKGIHDSFRADNGPAKAGRDAVPVQVVKLPRIGWLKCASRYAAKDR